MKLKIKIENESKFIALGTEFFGSQLDKMDEIIKNTYRTLMTRGMKGCYIYCVDKKLREYLKEQIKVRKNG